MDPLEREHWRRRIATKMGIFLEGGTQVTCVSGHYYDAEPYLCELCQTQHGQEVFVIKNRSGKKLHVEFGCLKEMIRFRVVDVEELERWIPKMADLKNEAAERRKLVEKQREEERSRLEKKIIIRKRPIREPA